MATRYTIVAGPSKMALMLNFFDKYCHPTVTFSLAHENRTLNIPDFEIDIVKIEVEDGSNESWCFEGYVKGLKGIRRAKGWFRTSGRRTGWIETIDD